jgi:hypothetical protein
VLRFLLDEHLPPALVEAVQGLRPEVEILALARWRDGTMLGADDETLLRAALADSLVLVTFDLRTVPELLRAWTEQGVPHAGVAFIHRRTLSPSDIGGLARALVALWDAEAEQDWVDRAVFLRRGQEG